MVSSSASWISPTTIVSCITSAGTHAAPASARKPRTRTWSVEGLFAAGGFIRTSESHFMGAEFAFDDQQLASIGYPTLVPHLSQCIDTEALTLQTVCALMFFPQDAPIEYAIHMGPCHSVFVPCTPPRFYLMARCWFVGSSRRSPSLFTSRAGLHRGLRSGRSQMRTTLGWFR